MDASLLFLLLATQVDATATFGLNAENRTGQRPLFAGGDDELVTEFELAPSIALDLALKRTTFSINYGPRAYTRINLQSENRILRPLLLHGFGAGFTHAFTSRVRLNFSAGGSVGEVDYGNIDLVQGTTQQVPTGDPRDPRVTAAGGTPSQEIFTTQDYNATLGLSWDVARNHSISIGGNGNYNTSLGDDSAFPDNYGGGGSLGWSWRFDPNYGFNMGVGYNESRVDPDQGSVGKFRSISADMGFALIFSRVFSAGISGGVLVADNDPVVRPGVPPVESGIDASPTGNLTFTFAPTSGRGTYDVTTTLGVGVEGFVDPLAGEGFAPRLAFNWSLAFIFFEDWSLTPSASLFTPLNEPPPPVVDPITMMAATDSLNETLVSFAVPLTYRINTELSMSLGLRVSGRGENLRQKDPEFGDWFVLGFLSFTAGVATRL